MVVHTIPCILDIMDERNKRWRYLGRNFPSPYYALLPKSILLEGRSVAKVSRERVSHVLIRAIWSDSSIDCILMLGDFGRSFPIPSVHRAKSCRYCNICLISIFYLIGIKTQNLIGYNRKIKISQHRVRLRFASSNSLGISFSGIRFARPSGSLEVNEITKKFFFFSIHPMVF